MDPILFQGTTSDLQVLWDYLSCSHGTAVIGMKVCSGSQEHICYLLPVHAYSSDNCCKFPELDLHCSHAPELYIAQHRLLRVRPILYVYRVMASHVSIISITTWLTMSLPASYQDATLCKTSNCQFSSFGLLSHQTRRQSVHALFWR